MRKYKHFLGHMQTKTPIRFVLTGIFYYRSSSVGNLTFIFKYAYINKLKHFQKLAVAN